MIPGFTKKYNVHRLVYFEAHPDMDAARQRERRDLFDELLPIRSTEL